MCGDVTFKNVKLTCLDNAHSVWYDFFVVYVVVETQWDAIQSKEVYYGLFLGVGVVCVENHAASENYALNHAQNVAYRKIVTNEYL